MPKEEDIEKLKTARDKCAQVYKDQACDEKPDNGNLINIHKAIIHLESAIESLEKRN